MKRIICLCCGIYVATFITTSTAIAISEQPSTPEVKRESTTAPPMNPMQELLELRSIVGAQGRQITSLQATLDAHTKKNDGNSTSIIAAFGVILAALVGGFFAFKNQNEQAKQGRLLKAVELIMDSRSGYQADIRRKNLSVFLDNETKQHLESIKDEFAGTEFTDLHVALAQAMSEKATTPQEVLGIWKSVLKGKKFYEKIDYPNA